MQCMHGRQAGTSRPTYSWQMADVISGLDLTAGGQISNMLALLEPVFRSGGTIRASWRGKTAGDEIPSWRWGIQLRLSKTLTLKL